MTDLDAIRARADAATEGPWTGRTNVHRDMAAVWESDGLLRITEVFNDDARSQGCANAEFIAHARTDVPALLDTLQAVIDICANESVSVKPQGIYIGGDPYWAMVHTRDVRRLIEGTGP